MLNESVVFGYERLDVWQKSVELANSIYTITRAFPREEMFGLTSQLRRAGVSIAANIAEGASRSSSRDQVRFFEIAYGSLNEVATLFHIACEQGFVERGQLVSIRRNVSDIGKMLSGLRKAASGL